MNELEESRNFRVPVRDKAFEVLVTTGEFDRGDDERGKSPADSVTSLRELGSGSLEELKIRNGSVNNLYPTTTRNPPQAIGSP